MAGVGRIDERHCTVDCDSITSAGRDYVSESRLGLALSADIGVFRLSSLPNFFGMWVHANLNQTRSVYAIGGSLGLGLLW
jgi:hypothetical protein